MPNVVGMTQSGATNTLLVAKLAVGKVTEVQTVTAPGGSVVSQEPAASTKVPEGTQVALAVVATASPSPTASTLPVPGVVGESQATAQTQLIGAGFVVVVSRESSTSVPSGDVITQTPSGGVVAAAGTTVTIVVSTGAPTASPAASATP